jgi:hypothetical protein
MRFVLKNLELILTLAGVVVIATAAAIGFALHGQVATITATTATAVGIVHGLLFWLVRRHQRLAREAALADVQHMLRDIINNQLAVIRLSADLQATGTGSRTAFHVESLQRSIEIIKQTLSELSEESLDRWRKRYDLPPR